MGRDRAGGTFALADRKPLWAYGPSALNEMEQHMATILWIIAVVLVIAGIVALFRRQILWGIVLIVVGLLVGPGGVSIFT